MAQAEVVRATANVAVEIVVATRVTKVFGHPGPEGYAWMGQAMKAEQPVQRQYPPQTPQRQQQHRPSDGAPPSFLHKMGMEELPFRSKLRSFLDKIVVEFVVIAIVLVYMVLILVDLLLANDGMADDGLVGWADAWSETFRYVDFGFLVFFTVELALRLYAYGLRYLKSFLNAFHLKFFCLF